MSATLTEVIGPSGPVRVRTWAADPDHDPDHDPVLLALHGWTDSSEVFGPLAEALGRRWTLIAPDAPGHGGTPWRPADRYRVTEHVADVLAVLDALPRPLPRRGPRQQPLVLLGHSMGGLTAARVAAARPARLDRLVLEDPACSTPRRAPSTPRMREWLRGLQATTDADRVEHVRRVHPDWPATERAPWARSKAETDPAHLAVPSVWGEPLIVALAQVRCPVLLVRGDPGRGGIVSRTAAAHCAGACAGGCEVLPLPAGHNPRREAPDLFVRALVKVLTEVTVPKAR
jgi:pimeloyl-ACP methyl ester carboxylesterase